MQVSYFGIFTTIFGSFLSGCANISTLQTARTVQGTRFIVGGGYFQSPRLDSTASRVTTGTAKNLKLPYLELGTRTGIASNLDLGIRATLPGTLSVDGKYELYATRQFAAAAGIGCGYLWLPVNFPSDFISGQALVINKEKSMHIVDLMLPLYASFDFSQKFGVYVSPKYFLRTILGGAEENLHLAGASLGIRLGWRSGAFLEGSYMVDLRSQSYEAYQLTLAIFFGTAPSTDSVSEPQGIKPGQTDRPRQ